MSAPEIALYFTAGALLGVVYLATLWFTVTWIGRTERPISLLAVSGIARIALLLGAFVLISGLEWKRLTACVVGFAVARFVGTAWARIEPARRDGFS